MKLRPVVCSVALAFVSTVVLANPPVRDVSHYRHSNLAAAQRLTRQAYNRVVDAQKANGYHLGRHAQRAKDLLEQASQELKEAAEVSNWNHR